MFSLNIGLTPVYSTLSSIFYDNKFIILNTSVIIMEYKYVHVKAYKYGHQFTSGMHSGL